MKWSIQQLRKLSTEPYHFKDFIDFSSYIEGVDDILSIDKALVEGNIYHINDDTYRIVYRFIVDLNLQCAITLDPVPYHMDFSYDEIYSKSESEEAFLIEKNTLDLDEIVWSNILVEKPINVSLPNAHEILKERGIYLDDTINLDDDEEILYYSDGNEEED